MNKYVVRDIPEESFFSQPIYLDTYFILAAPETPFSKELLSALLEWDFREVYSDGEPMHGAFAQNADIAKAAKALLSQDPGSQEEILKCANEFYWLFQKYAEELFTQVSEDQDLNFEAVSANIRVACQVITRDRRFMLWVQQQYEPKKGENYQVSHAVKTMILSLMIGSALKLPEAQLIELGTTALLHEIGMMKLPSRIYLTKWSLTPEERKTILTHPIIGYKLLKSFAFPAPVCLGTLEHHERENSAGYPQRIPGEKIGLYAKIIAVACSYEAITTSRPYKRAKDKHAGILEILKNEGKGYDDTIIRALVYCLSLYPIGLYVMLANGKKAQVVDVDTENPRFPKVKILGVDKDGRGIVVQTSPQLPVTRPLTREEIF